MRAKVRMKVRVIRVRIRVSVGVRVGSGVKGSVGLGVFVLEYRLSLWASHRHHPV